MRTAPLRCSGDSKPACALSWWCLFLAARRRFVALVRFSLENIVSRRTFGERENGREGGGSTLSLASARLRFRPSMSPLMRAENVSWNFIMSALEMRVPSFFLNFAGRTEAADAAQHVVTWTRRWRGGVRGSTQQTQRLQLRLLTCRHFAPATFRPDQAASLRAAALHWQVRMQRQQRQTATPCARPAL